MSSVTQLGYIGFKVTCPEKWEQFGTQFLGLTLGQRFETGAFTLRMDNRISRLTITPGDKDDLDFVGWEVATQSDLNAIRGRLEARGIEVCEESTEYCAARCVEGLIRFRDPSNIQTEVYYGPIISDVPFSSKVVRSGFITNDQGLGHVVLTARSQKESEEFYNQCLGLQLSDRIECTLGSYEIGLSFWRANSRHHSLALGGLQQKRLHHFMVQMKSLDDVGRALDRAPREGVPIVQGLGRHPNDRMISFYAMTPSGFQVEVGSSGIEIDETSWNVTTHRRISEWGHRKPPPSG
jgi:2,3-dihydroxybiphenyl 1,2-dioxygenase